MKCTFRGKNNKKSIRKILILIYLVSVIPVYLLTLGMNLYAQNRANEYVEDTIRSNASRIADELRIQMETLTSSLLNLTTSDDVNRLTWGPNSHISTYEYIKSQRAVTRMLRNILIQFPYVSNVDVYCPSIEKKLTAGSGGKDTLVALEEEDQIFLNSIDRWSSGMTKLPDGRLCVYLSNLRERDGALSGYAYAAFLNQSRFGAMESHSKMGDTLILQYEEMLLAEPPEHVTALCSDFENSIDAQLNTRDKCIIVREPVGNGPLSIILVHQVEPFNLTQAFRLWLVALLMLASVMVLLYIRVTHKSITVPLSDLGKAFQRIENGNLQVEARTYNCLELDQLYERYRIMSGKLSEYIDREYRQKLLMEQMQHKLLQMQINPHFLYNTYFVMNSFLYTEAYESALEMSDLLGRYLKYITREDDGSTTLADEVEFARVYLEIRRMRGRRSLLQQMGELPQSCAGLRVPRLILQPLIENAYEHGLKGAQEGTIAVKYLLQGDRIRICVENSGMVSEELIDRLKARLAGRSLETDGVALVNVHQRLKFAFGADCGLEVYISELGGLGVAIALRIEDV